MTNMMLPMSVDHVQKSHELGDIGGGDDDEGNGKPAEYSVDARRKMLQVGDLAREQTCNRSAQARSAHSTRRSRAGAA